MKVIYFVTCCLGLSEFIKIGITASVESLPLRMKTLQIGCPVDLVLFGWIRGTLNTEEELHRMFSGYNVGGEWFRYAEEIKDYIQAHVEPQVKASRDWVLEREREKTEMAIKEASALGTWKKRKLRRLRLKISKIDVQIASRKRSA